MKRTYDAIVDGLNDAQREVVTAVDGPLLVVAGPGTGKTLTIVRRIAYLLCRGVRPESVLAVTFTNRAAREMRERMESLLGPESKGVFVGTFHLLGLMILRDAIFDDFVVYSRDEQFDVVKGLCKGEGRKAKELVERISRVKSLAETPSEKVLSLCRAYESLLREKGAVDFDDLIVRPIELLEDPQVVSSYRKRFNHIIVDEYQDINPAQYRLLRLVAGDEAGVCGVGDPDQAIYAFRGADGESFLRFESDFAGARTITLRSNYRSSAMILNGADTMIKSNRRRIERELQPTKGMGERIRVISVPDERCEGRVIVNEIEERVGGTSHYKLLTGGGRTQPGAGPYGFSDFAVMFRTNGQAKPIEEAFRASGIPYRLIGDRPMGGGRSVIGTLRAFALRCPPDLWKDLSTDDFLEMALEGLGREDNEGLPELMNYLSMIEGDGGIHGRAIDFLNTISLLGAADGVDPRAKAVTLMTLHMGKGLEFKVVFMVGCEEGLMPFSLSGEPADVEEERRLFYVGMTRAREELFLLSARSRLIYGMRRNQRPSRFLGEIPTECVERKSVPDGPQKQKRHSQMTLF